MLSEEWRRGGGVECGCDVGSGSLLVVPCAVCLDLQFRQLSVGAEFDLVRLKGCVGGSEHTSNVLGAGA